MALKTFVKVSGINNLSDARYCAGMEVNQLGFEVEEGSDNYVDPQSFNEIKGWLSGVEFVGEINNAEANISGIIAGYELDAVQVKSINQITAAQKTGLKVVFFATDLASAHEVADKHAEHVDYILLEQEISPKDLADLTSKAPVVLLAGFDAENVVTVAESSIKGISIRGGQEIRPGYKDFDEMADILEALEIDDLAND